MSIVSTATGARYHAAIATSYVSFARTYRQRCAVLFQRVSHHDWYTDAFTILPADQTRFWTPRNACVVRILTLIILTLECLRQAPICVAHVCYDVRVLHLRRTIYVCAHFPKQLPSRVAYLGRALLYCVLYCLAALFRPSSPQCTSAEHYATSSSLLLHIASTSCFLRMKYLATLSSRCRKFYVYTTILLV